MGKIEFSNCQDVRNQKRIQELDCPRCHEPGGIEAFVKDGILAEDGVCAVSYTHLDVYKRQVDGKAAIHLKIKNRFCLFKGQEAV